MGNTYYTADYCRYSSKEDDTKESNSIISQREINKEFIAHLQEIYPEDTFIHIDSYSDDDWTGTNFNRPGFKRLKEDCISGKINCIVVKDHSRFGRNSARMTVILEDDLGDIRYISNLDHFDSRFDDYDSLFQIKTTFNQMYAEDISRKVHSSVDTKQRQGKFIGSFCSYGYVKNQIDKHTLDIDENVKYVIEMIFDLRLKGMNLQSIARHLNELLIPPPSVYKKMQGLNYSNFYVENFEGPHLWTYSTVYKILTNETYMGNLVQGRIRQKMRRKAKKKPKEEWVIAKGACPAIISEEKFMEVQRLMKEANHVKADYPTKEIKLFSGFLKCGDCQHSFIRVQRGKHAPLYYACRTRKAQGKQYCDNSYIREDVLEKIILDDLNTILQEISDLTALIDTKASIVSQKRCAERQLAKLNADVRKTIRKRRFAYCDYQDDILSKQDYFAIKASLEQAENQLNIQIKNLQIKLNTLECPSETNSLLDKLIQTRHMNKLDREILQEMIEKIYIYKDNRIKIIYKFSNETETRKEPLV